MGDVTQAVEKFTELQKNSNTEFVIMGVFFTVFMLIFLYFILEMKAERKDGRDRYNSQLARDVENQNRLFEMIKEQSTATANSTEAMKASSKIAQKVANIMEGTKEMHDEFDEKIDGVREQVKVIDVKVDDLYREMKDIAKQHNLNIEEFAKMVMEEIKKKEK